MAITMKEIAKYANTSIGTVDRVINNRPGVSEETRKRVLKVIKEYNYETNAFGRALVNSKKVFNIGIIIPSIGNEFFEMIKKGINKAESIYKKSLNIKYIELKGYNELEQSQAIKKLVLDNIHGLVITPTNTEIIKNELNALNIPIVQLVSNIESNCLAYVGCNYYNNGELGGDLASEVVDGGSALIVTGSDKIVGHQERVQGFTSRFLENEKNKIVSIVKNEDDDDLSYEVVKKELSLKKDIDLIYFASSGISGGLKAVFEFSDRKFKIITVDEAESVRVNLKKGKIVATISQQPQKQGYRAIDILREYLFYKKEPEKKSVIIGNRVKLRSSNLINGEFF